MALSVKQKAFINAYLATFNATEAARQAKYRGDDATLASIGWENLRKPEIADAISQRLSESAMSANEVLNRLADQARGSMDDFVSFNKNGDPYFDFPAATMMGKLNLAKKLKTKTRSWSEPYFDATTDEIEQRQVTETAIEFELYDAQAALVHIGKHHKLFTDKIEVEHGGSIEITPDQRAQALKELDEWKQKKSAETSSG